MRFSPKNIKIIKKVLEFCVYIVVGYFVYAKLEGNFSELKDITIDIPFVMSATLLFATHSIWNGLNWDYLVRSSGERTVLDQQMRVYLKSYLMRYIPGNVVGIMGRALLNKPFGIPMFKSLWGWFFENIVYLAIGIFLGSYAVLITQFATDSVGILMLFALVAGLFIVLKNDFLERLFEGKIASKLPEKAQREISPLTLSTRARIEMLWRYGIAWGIYSFSFILVVASMVDLNWQDIPGLISVNALAYSVGYLSFVTPSGAGVRESVMVFALTSALGYTAEVALVIAIVARVVSISGELLGFGSYYLYYFSSKKNGKQVSI